MLYLLSVDCLLLYDCCGWLVCGYCFCCFVVLVVCCGWLQLLVVLTLISSDFAVACWFGLDGVGSVAGLVLVMLLF